MSARLTLALYQPDIPQNTGAMFRLCACMGVEAAVIEPTGFPLSDRALKRSGMDYIEHLSLTRYLCWEDFYAFKHQTGRRLILLTTKGSHAYTDFAFEPDDILMVGRESCGVPISIAHCADTFVRIPLRPPCRSLNVALSAALVIGEALRQLGGFPS